MYFIEQRISKIQSKHVSKHKIPFVSKHKIREDLFSLKDIMFLLEDLFHEEFSLGIFRRTFL